MFSISMSDGESSRPKRLKATAQDGLLAIHPGSQVRLVNLPAHPGLEGVLATVLSIEDDSFLNVEINKTKVVKTVCRYQIFSRNSHLDQTRQGPTDLGRMYSGAARSGVSVQAQRPDW